MKNLKFTLFTLSFLVLTQLHAQEESEFKNEFHLNSTRFIANYLNFGNNVNSNNPYLLGYKRVFNNTALRVGFMGNFNNSNGRGPLLRNYVSNSSLELRLGYEWRKDLHKKWSIFYGFDVATKLDNNKNTRSQSIFFNGNEIVIREIRSTSDNNFGLGPVAGIQWNLSNRISLMAESRAYIFYRENLATIKWKDVPEQLGGVGSNYEDIVENSSYNTRIDFFLPLDIFLIIKL